MIAGIFHEGSGLGNQLFRYITTRTLAEEKGFEWGMIGRDLFKGNFFNDFELGVKPNAIHKNQFLEKKIVQDGIDVRGYDPEINFVQDNTTIEGEFQDPRYWEHKLSEIDKWLAVEPLDVSDGKCLIGFRGGEYYSDPNLGLPPSYFDEAMSYMPNKTFEVHTEDTKRAAQFFPDIPIVENNFISHSNYSNMAYNWRAMRYAKHTIISNSSFYIIPRLLKHQEDKDAITIAPRYWARRNIGVWALPSNYYKQFLYV